MKAPRISDAHLSLGADGGADRPVSRRMRVLVSRQIGLKNRLHWRGVWARLQQLEQPRLWLLALAVGILAGYAAVFFVGSIWFLHQTLYGASEENLATAAAELHWLLVLTIPIVGGLFVGLLTHHMADDRPPFGVADVIEARALRQGRLDVRCGIASVIGAALSLGFGASGGREGPAVVAGASVASAVSNAVRLNAMESRTLLGCAVAAAVSASFNAPIAGALFALEVVLGHYAVRAFAPITIASVAGALISRAYFGDTPAFESPVAEFGSYAQFPAFALLGLLSAMTAAAMMWSIFLARDAMDKARARIGAPIWLQPAMAGGVLGLIAIAFPHTIAVGYQTTTGALAGAFDFWTCILFVVVKIAAVAVTLGGRFVGGVFSPALMLGALTGAAFGAVAVDVFPSVSGSAALYALAGMGACAGAVLGAPISTTLIVFEMTGDYDTAIAVMVSTSVATVATQQALQKSFFHWQLSKRGIDLTAGPQTFLLPTMRVGGYMRPRGADDGVSDTAAWELVEQNVDLRPDDSLQKALPMFKNGSLSFLPVVDVKTAGQGKTLVGALFYVDALRAYNRALVAMHEEEHS